jgi:hypothetical protein
MISTGLFLKTLSKEPKEIKEEYFKITNPQGFYLFQFFIKESESGKRKRENENEIKESEEK